MEFDFCINYKATNANLMIPFANDMNNNKVFEYVGEVPFSMTLFLNNTTSKGPLVNVIKAYEIPLEPMKLIDK